MASPVILVPGYGGSRLEAKLFRSENDGGHYGYFCPQTSDWMTIWVNIKLMLPFFIECLIDIMRLYYDPTTNTTNDMPGVEVRVKRSADSTLDSVEYFTDNLQFYFSGYFAQIIQKLTNELGYVREKSLKGAAYDFRKAPNELSDFLVELKTMTEHLFVENNNQPVSYICHSMGCNNMLHFLQRQPKNWKKLYVKRLISLAAPWAGTVSALRATAVGHDFGAPFLFNQSQLLTVQRSLPSTVYLLPHPEEFGLDPLIRVNVGRESNHSTQSFNTHNYEQFFEAIRHEDGYKMYQSTKNLLGALEAPEVELWCLVGLGHSTLTRIDYEGKFPHSASKDYRADGDGTVELRSAKYCTKWHGKQLEPIHYVEFHHSHIGMLRQENILKFIANILAGNSTAGSDLNDRIDSGNRSDGELKESGHHEKSGAFSSINYNIDYHKLFSLKRIVNF